MKIIKRNTGIIIILAFNVLIFFQAHLAAQQLNDKFKLVDELFEQWDRTNSPGCSIAIIKDGKIIYTRGYGMANLDYGIPNKPETVFRIGSTSKQFTAACIQILHEQGKLSIHDNIRKYLPEMPEYEAPITIEHLVHHTSGIRDYLVLQSMAGVDNEANYSPENVLYILSRQKELNFKPGDEFLYSNSGYLLMGLIVKRVSGTSLAQFAEEKIFGMLGMKNTHFHDDNTRIVRNRATGYSKSGSVFRVAETINECVGDGAVFTTVEDLFIWDQNFYNNKLSSSSFIRNLLKTFTLNNNKELDYAFGLRHSKYKGLKVVSHGGSFVGFRADMARFPQQRFTVICLANFARSNPSLMCHKVADIFLKDYFVESEERKAEERPQRQRREVSQVELTPKQLEEFTGDFYSDELLITYKLREEEGKLYFKHKNTIWTRQIKPIGIDRFDFSRGRIEFKRDENGRIFGFAIQAGRVKNIFFNKVD